MPRVRVEFNEREAIDIDNVYRVIDDLLLNRVTFEHRGGATTYDGAELAGWGIHDDDEEEDISDD